MSHRRPRQTIHAHPQRRSRLGIRHLQSLEAQTIDARVGNRYVRRDGHVRTFRPANELMLQLEQQLEHRRRSGRCIMLAHEHENHLRSRGIARRPKDLCHFDCHYRRDRRHHDRLGQRRFEGQRAVEQTLNRPRQVPSRHMEQIGRPAQQDG